jgi:hypothetical protein
VAQSLGDFCSVAKVNTSTIVEKLPNLVTLLTMTVNTKLKLNTLLKLSVNNDFLNRFLKKRVPGGQCYDHDSTIFGGKKIVVFL